MLSTESYMYYGMERFQTLEEALKFMKQYMEDYNPEGYATELNLSYHLPSLTPWFVEIERSRSCD